MAKHHVSATLNGDEVEFLCETGQTLLEVLRDELHFTGTKEGCGTGDCGACSVTVDGRLVCSCLVLGVEAQGKSIQTIEGMAASYEDPAAVVKWYYENPQQLQQIEGMCLEDEAVNWIASRAQLSEQAVTFDALMNPVQTDNTTEAST